MKLCLYDLAVKEYEKYERSFLGLILGDHGPREFYVKNLIAFLGLGSMDCESPNLNQKHKT